MVGGAVSDPAYRRRPTESREDHEKRIRKLLPPVFEGILETNDKPLTGEQIQEIKRRIRNLKD